MKEVVREVVILTGTDCLLVTVSLFHSVGLSVEDSVEDSCQNTSGLEQVGTP